ncbi:MAG TPA: hypothetical protein EYM95_08715, partial [Candidatus Obscuribacterales bacterium]|nr:hypothetical protein [Candidatus Obscuribacterales bacterium]
MKVVEKSKATKQGQETDTQAKGQGQKVPRGERREILRKFPVKVNLENYEEAYRTFEWEDARKEITYFAGGKVNAAYNAIDRHLHDGRRNKVALYAIDAKENLQKFTFQEIYEASNKIGNALKELGVKKGDRVFVFLPRVPELYTATTAIAKIGAIAGP